MKKLYGTGVALVTPFTNSGEVDYRGLKKLLRYTAKGSDYYVVMGTTGESPTVTSDEKKEILRFVRTNNEAKLPIVYGIGGNNTQAVLDAIGETDFTGVSAVLSVSPYYNKPSQEGIYQHYEAVADACPVPVVLYNVPGRTSSNITAETTLRLAEHPNIIGTKEASGNVEQCMHIARNMPRDFLLISGDDLFTLPLYALGGRGVISVLANAYPTIFRKMKEHAFKGDFGRASREAFKILELHPLMYVEGNPVALKFLLAEMGVCGETVRLPLTGASEGLKEKIRQARPKNKG